MAKKDNSSIEEKKWYKNIIAVITLVGAIIGGLTGLFKIIIPLFEDGELEKVPYNVQIVLDRSAAMGDAFEGATKLEAAKKAIEKKLDLSIRESDNLALRIFGGICGEKNTELEVGFHQKNEDKVRKRLRKIEAAGEGSLLSAILEAIGDFSQEQFQGVTNSLIIIAGGWDTCYPDEDPNEFIRSRKDSSLIIDFQFLDDLRIVGIGLTVEQRALFEQLSAAMPGAETFFPENLDELERATGSPDVANALKAAKQLYASGKKLYDNKDYDKALVKLQKAGENNIAYAMHYLGTIYARGHGASQVDYGMAAHWYRKGADLNNPICMFNLGVLYELPVWKTPNVDSAKVWYRKAVALGHQDARARLDEIGDTP